MMFRLLGPLRIEEGAPALVSSVKVRTVLAVLLLNANRTVSSDALYSALWSDEPPTSARASLRNNVAALRRHLGERGRLRVRSSDSGYLIQLEPGELDIEEFAAGSKRARAARLAGDWAGVVDEATGALALWRGDPLEDIPVGAWSEQAIEGLQIARLELLEWRFDAEITLGRHQGLVGELAHWVELHPFREELQRQLMLALHRSGRRADALDTYQRLRQRLSDELGIEPTPAVQRAYLDILRDGYQPVGSLTLSAGEDAPASVVPPSAPPAENAAAPAHPRVRTTRRPIAVSSGRSGRLPVDTRVFTGRTEELSWLLQLGRRAADGSDSGMALIVGIDGMGGVGKSALAVHAAHELKGEFPDGQLYIDLHGHTPGVEPLAVAEALGQLLRSLGVAPALIPRDPEERAAAFQDRLAGTRTLLVLDNAAGLAEIRPLLPGKAGSLVLVTSRRRLSGLDDAHLRTLEPLPDAEARALLYAVAGPDRIPLNSPAVTELAALCGSIPLALRVAASRLRNHRSLQIEEIVAELRDEAGRAATIDMVFASSLSALPASEQRLFRLLGLIPGPDFDATAVSWLLGDDIRNARYQLESLLDHNLLQQPSVGRYRFHDLARLFARSLATSLDEKPGTEAEPARARLVDYYLYAAQVADRVLTRRNVPEPCLPPAPEPLPIPDLHDAESAQFWWRAEWANLWACANDTKTMRGRADAVAGFSTAVGAFALREGHWPQAAALHQQALERARTGGDIEAEARALTELGRTRLTQGAVRTARELHEQALPLYRDRGDRFGEADSLWELGRASHMGNDHEAAAALHQQALAIYRELGSIRGEANALWALGRSLRMRGELDSAAEHGRQALLHYRRIGDRQGIANGLWDLGRVADLRGDFEESVQLLEEVLGLYEELGSRVGEANALSCLGRALRRMGKLDDAAKRLEASLVLYEELSEPHGLTLSRHDLGLVRWGQGDLEDATRLLTLVSDTYRTYREPVGASRSLHELAQVRRDANDYAASARLLVEALDHSREAGDTERTAEVLRHAKQFAAEAAAAFPTA
ncbi:hypothetical protein DN069_20795 [Streptacidiphilus pinicola]|uniref:OmpR/PhoB-type domain-containing protein n=1 Tax=Streptacidiphilus pinicola TaxID=2219663 RepID=A0A2X0IF87_9ACTN|nr:BTAD domain-containing putative transcriptional regulator [Streptacidiphilus pinicola]RAG83694.1 hypothetical protein DN069_20795 [Streptacidiphilus pinicola]